MSKIPTKVVDGKKLCNKCNTFKILAEFPKKSKANLAISSAHIYATHCIMCTGLRNRKLKKCDYDDMLLSQGGVCAICGTDKLPKNGGPGGEPRFFVDHDHKTGRVRGLLCSKCNGALGMLKDSIDLLQSAISYLQRFA